MPLAKGKSKAAVASRFAELYADNKKKGKARGANGKVRSKAQILAIAISASKRGKKS